MVAIKQIRSLSDSELDDLRAAVKVEFYRRCDLAEALRRVPNARMAKDYLIDVASGESDLQDHLIAAARRHLVTRQPTFKKTIEKAIRLTRALHNLNTTLRGPYDYSAEWNKLSAKLNLVLSRLR